MTLILTNVESVAVLGVFLNEPLGQILVLVEEIKAVLVLIGVGDPSTFELFLPLGLALVSVKFF